MPSAYGSTVGILSLGHVGREVADRLRRLDVKVIGYDPHFSPADARALGVELCSLEDVFARSDVVTCHTPLLPATTHLLREHHFSRMKPDATFINTARGAIVHEAELISTLTRRPEIFVVLDVTDPEPPLESSPLFALPNVLLTPHISGSIGPECRRMSRMIIEEARRYVSGVPLQGEVKRQNLDWLARMVAVKPKTLRPGTNSLLRELTDISWFPGFSLKLFRFRSNKPVSQILLRSAWRNNEGQKRHKIVRPAGENRPRAYRRLESFIRKKDFLCLFVANAPKILSKRPRSQEQIAPK